MKKGTRKNLTIKKNSNNTKKKRLSLKWAGALKEYKDRFTSLELQKKSLEWWTG